jgi:uncharacterized repeat protein (TIGR01451 family)
MGWPSYLFTSIAAFFIASATVSATNIIHEFYVPMPDAQIRTALVSIEPASGIVGTTMESVISIVVTGAGSIIHYDEWEDGYEIDINNPVQTTTKIWGDGNNANGVPPGYANDPAGLASGAVVNLRNQITLPRNPAVVLYDGRDRFGGNKALVVTRTGWAVAPGTVLAGSVEVTATMDYDTSYIVPVGQDVTAASMFEYVGLMVMARENGTSVTVDVNGPVSGGATTFTLNQGESYLVNGGILKGATVTATKPVQTQLITGDIGARYETDWFTLYPTDQWTGTYYSPVGTASDGDPAYGFFYNSNASPITINVRTCLGTGSFSVPANSVHQYQMPQNCGARFTSTNSEPFFGIVTVGANPSANNVHDWGFTLVPSESLTTEAVVGWGPGSSDLTQNGSPVWVTPIAATRIYVDYNGDGLGALTDPKGKKYDVHHDMVELETRRISDPDRDQSAMRVYTLNGVQIAAAWGQDPATAGPGNPFIDVGTTVLPFPVPTLIKSVVMITDTAPTGFSIGDTIEYRIEVDNKGLLPLGNLLVLDPLNPSLTYSPNSTRRDGSPIADNPTGTAFPLDESGYLVPIILRGGRTMFTYRCTINASGSIANTATNSNYNLISTTNVVVPPPAGSTPCGAQFTNAGGTPQSSYPAGNSIFGTITDPDANNNVGAIETITVVVNNTSNGDAEFVTLTETGVNTGIFRNISGLPTSTTIGTNQMDGTLLVSSGNSLSFSYTDPEFNETCSNTASISIPTQTKVLYLSTDGTGSPDQDMDRIDPVVANDLTTATSQTLQATSGGGTVTLSASKDTWINALSTTLNYGVSTTMNIDRQGGGLGEERSLLQFDLSSIPAGAIITSAQLRLTKTGGATASQNIGVYRVTSAWDEGTQNGTAGTANWSQRQSGTNWTTAGGDSNASAEDTVAVAGNAAYTWNLASLVQGWMSGTFVNNGVLLGSPDTGGDNPQQFGSLQNGTPANRPQLIVSYTTVALDAVSSVTKFDPIGTVSVSHTTGTGTNRLMLVGISFEDDNTAGLGISGVTYNGQALTFVDRQLSSQEAGCEIWRLVNPPSGPGTVQVTTTGSAAGDAIFVGVATFSGVDQSTPLGTPAKASGTGTSASVTTVSGPGEIVFDVLAVDDARSASPDGAQTVRWNGIAGTADTDGVRAGASTKAGAASVTTTWTIGSDAWSLCAVPIKPASSSSSITFTQTPSFATSFSLPTGGTTNVTTYVNVISGTLPATPNVTALLKYGANTIATLTNPTYNSGAGTLVWSGTLGTPITVPSGQPIDLVLTSNQTGAEFNVQYDSTTRPSKVSLPTTTVITNTQLAVYDAPYPGGNIVTGPASGTTVYVRGTASDPFGAYDITSMGLSIDGPGTGGDITTTLGAGHVVDTTAATKTYEYAWTVGATVGTYNIVTTANEGTEGIFATRATSVTVTFLDLGTPSTTEFTTGLNGPGTPTYAGNEQVCVRIIDLDQNLNPAVAETIQATITSAIGDSELVTLTETGINTGVFAFCIPASTTAPNTHNNGTLHAVLGDVLTVNYVDPTDPTDTGTDTATIPNLAPAIRVNKTLLTPADGQALVGEALQYAVQVINTGNTVLNTIGLTDTFPTADLTFVNASVAPNSTLPAGTLTWTNVGPLSPGQSITITLNFTALSTAAPAVNSATANAGGGVTSTDTANVTITDPRITLTKTLISPNPGPASINDSVVFRIAVQNTGDTAIATLPIEDTFSGADFDFVSATVAPDAAGSGSLLWLDVTGTGNLAVGSSITIDVTFTAKGAAAPAVNLAKAEYTVDVNGDSAPPRTSTATITLLAAKITGHVYDDVDQSVTFNGGDGVLEGVTISLFSDPNGDGNPADGTLLNITTTNASGYYEFLNLGLGNYVVVESQPLGYSSSGDTVGANDNRIPQVIASLTTLANRNFFDFLTPPLSYGSIAGRVWNDANASATVNGGEVGIENVAVDLVEDTNNNGIADPGEPVLASSLTAADGTYSFSGLSAGNYVVVENDLFNWYSTADTVGPNNNMIPVALGAGQNVTGRDFLDVLTGTTGGKVFHDVNGNGSFDAGDVALANIDLLITDSLGVTQTVVTNASGDWNATVPPGSTTVDVQQSDPQFTAVFAPLFGFTQTAGTDTSTVVVVSGVNTPGGDDGFRQLGEITGHLYIDTNGDGDQDPGEPDLANVDVLITNVAGGTQTVTTNSSGNWTASVPPGSTSANVQEIDPQFPVGGIQTQGTDPTIVTVVANSSTSGGIDGYFLPATISGTVFADNNNDNVGDSAMEGVTISLFTDPNGDGDPSDGAQVGSSVLTNPSGLYTFANLVPGRYVVVQTQPVGYLTVTDSDTTIDSVGSPADAVNSSTTDNQIPVNVMGGETDNGNSFIEELPGGISGTVRLGSSPLAGVDLSLFSDPNSDGDPSDGVQVGGNVQTNGSGVYTFSNVPPGSYVVVQTQPSGYVSVGDGDTTVPNDDTANGSQTDNRIPVGITAGETDDGNDFTEACPTITVNPSTLPNGVVGTTYSQILSATGGTGAYSFAVTSGSLPAGLSLTAGEISGIPTSSTGSTFTITATDSLGCTGTRSYTVTPVCPTITLNPASLSDATVGTLYNQTLSATGGTAAYSFSVTAGALPLGLTLSGDTITGTPTAAGTASFTVTVTDANGCTGNRAMSITSTCPTIVVSPSSLPDGVVGVAYTQTLSATGGTAGYTFAVTSGALPPGLTLTGATISGTPTSTSSSTFTITATDANSCVGATSFTIATTCPTISLTSIPASLPSGTVGVSYSGTINATGGTAGYTYAVKVGSALPPGLNISSAGAITGTPTTNGTTNTIIVATDVYGCKGEATFPINIGCNTLAVTPGSIGDGVVGAAYGPVAFNSTGGTGTVTWSQTGALPIGMTLSSGGVLSGTPTSGGSFTITVIATDSNLCAGSVNLTFSVSCPTVTVNPTTLPNGVVGSSYNQSLSATGGTAPYTFGVTAGSLPAGLTLSGGTISGIPTSSASSDFTITATDANGCTGSRDFTLAPTCPTITLNPVSLSNGVVGTSYMETLSGSGGTAPYTFAVTVGSLPAGLSLSGNEITGIPTATTSATFTITATDSHGCTGTRSFTLAPVCPTITVNPATLPNGVLGTGYSQTLTGSGGSAPYTFAVTAGSLPAGLSLTGGIISGTPTSEASQTFTITATDNNGCEGTRSFTLAPTCPTITVNPTSLPSALVGVSYSQTLSASGGTAPFSYLVSAGVLPDGLILSGDTISGIPTSTASQTFTITVTDTNGCEGSRSFTLAPTCPTISLNSTPVVLPSGTIGAAYSGTIHATGGTAPYTFAVKIGSALPSGLTIDSAGAITGTPTVNGTTSTIIEATDANGCKGESSFTINVACNTLAVAPTSIENGVVGVAYTPVTFQATGGTGVITWLQTGLLPTGMTLSSGGVLSGTPTEAGSFTISVIATDENLCSGNVSLTFSTSCPTVTVNPATLPDAALRTAYSQTLTALGGTAPYTYAVTAGALPSGLSLTGDTISGVPTASGVFSFSITATDSLGCSGMRSFTVGVLSGTIGGHLYIDTNGNGTQEIGEPNLADVNLLITESGGGLQTVTTDANGDWVASVPAGDTIADVDETDPQFPLGSVQSQGTDPTTVAAVAGINTEAGIDGYFIPGSISGSVFADTDNDNLGNSPIASVLLTLKDSSGNDIDSDSNITGVQPTTTLTAPNGSYSFSGLPPGIYQVVETDPAGYSSVTPNQVTPVSVTAGNITSGVDFIDEQFATISGCVHRDDNNDDLGDVFLPGVTVTLFTDPNGDGDPTDGAPVDDPFQSGVQPYAPISDTFGNYQFEMITPGSYVIVQTQPVGYLTAADRDDTADAAGSPVDATNINTIDNRIPVTVAAGETDDGNHFVEELPAAMGNLVWNDANGNGTKDSGESGIDGVIVELLDGSGNPIDSDPVTSGTQPTRTTTAGGGLYAFANLAPGSYQMRIGAPPSAYPQAATPVVSLDNGVDDDSNGSQLNPGGAITSPVIVLAANETDNTVDFGLKALVGVYSISGQVRDDYDLDGNFSDSDQPVANVNVELYIDSDGSGTFDAGIDTLLDTKLTNGLGQYQFASLPNGTYFVREIDPNPSDSTADTDGPNDNLIKVTISGSNSTGNDFLDAVDPAGYIYSPVDGRIIAGGSISVSGPGSVTILLDGSTGQYSFITDTAGTYTMTYSPPLGYMIDPTRPVAAASFDPTGLSDPHSLGSAENPANPGYLTNFSALGNPYYFTFDLAPGDPFVINNNIPLVEIKPTTFASWQYANPLGGQNGPTQDPDGDGLTNLEEFAFCYQPNSGVATSCPLRIVRNGDGTLDAEVRRVSGITGVTYTLEYIADLTASGANGAGWTDVTTISPVVGTPIGGVEIADYRDLAQIPALSGGKGYVRVKVSDGVNTVRTYAAGWGTKVMPVGCQSGGQPYLKCAIFSGGVDGVTGSVLDITTSAGGSSLVGQFVVGAQYYVEVTSGDNAGHRWDVLEASTTATSIAIDTASPGNTKATVPANLAGDSIVVRQHLTFAEAYPPASFTGHTDPALADRLLFFDRTVGAFRVFWLFNGSTKRWVAAGDAFLTNRNNDVLDPCAGHFVHPKTNSVTQVYTGEIRENAFACPLMTGNNLITGGWPIDLSPAQMAMTNASGFTGNRDPAKSDRLHLWVGDTVPGTEGYDTHFYLVRGALNQWTTSANANIANENNVSFLKAHGGFSLQMISPVDWVIPRPWTP